jgi:S1-C subfamily serine protease
MPENRFFIKSTEQSGLTPVVAAGEPAIASYERIIDEIEQRCGREVANLFAEPVFPRGGEGAPSAISWYGRREGVASELADFDDIARRPIVERLERRITGLRAALEDPRLGPIVRAWLNIGSVKDILVIGGEPILVNWGHLPTGLDTSEVARRAHSESTFGRFLPHLAEFGFGGSVGDGRPDAAHNAIAPPPAPAPHGPSAPMPTRGSFVPNNVPAPPPWRAPLIASGVVALLLLAVLIPGVLVYPAASDHEVRDAFEIDRLNASNESLEAQIRALGSAAKDRSCLAPGEMVSVPGLPGTKDPRMQIVPPSPDNAALPPMTNGKANVRTVADLLEKATVLVFAFKSAESQSLGSGFFISDRQIVTNHHVIADVDPELVFVASQALGGIRHARVVAKTEPPPDGKDFKPDFAILEVEPVQSAPALKLGPTPAKLSTAYVAGFPGFVTVGDAAFETFVKQLGESVNGGKVNEALLRQKTAVPGSDLRYGRINNIIVPRGGHLQIIIHDMQLAFGNSGGPLVDGCGQLGGVNTATWEARNSKNDDQRASGIYANVAQDVSTLKEFLQDRQIAFQSDEKRCDGAVAQTPPGAPPGGGAVAPVGQGTPGG